MIAKALAAVAEREGHALAPATAAALAEAAGGDLRSSIQALQVRMQPCPLLSLACHPHALQAALSDDILPLSLVSR